jgi:Zn-dependent protease with chaperone function
MNFFEAQDSARARSRTLVGLFIAAVIAIVAAIYAVAHLLLGLGPAGVQPEVLAVVAVFTTALIVAGSTVRTLQLRQGGGKVAELLGGRRIRSNTTDEAERRLVNVVEEMAIASGTPMPAIYVMDQEPGINAFAAGYTMDDAAVAVTRGTLEQLNREELQGVIAHEFSHILNGDMRLNIRLMGILFGILLLAIVGRGVMRSGAYAGGGRGCGSNNSGAQVAIFGLALVAVGYIGVFFGKLIQAAVSRQREYLADSSAVQFTRNPGGIAGALKKIGGIGSRIEDHHAQEAGHLFFANGLGSSLASMLATHPPLDERIRRIDAGFADQLPSAQRSRGTVSAQGARGAQAASAGTAGAAGFAGADLPAAAGRVADISGAALLASIGAPQPEHVAWAGQLLESLPPGVRDAAHEPDAAPPLLFALLLHEEEGDAARQHDVLRAHGQAALLEATTAHARALQPLGRAVRLPLLDIMLPALRELSPEQQEAVRSTAARLAGADERMDMFEFALLHVLNRQLAPAPASGRREPEPQPVRSFDALRGDIEIILSAAAWSGTDDLASARSAFEAGAASMHRQTGAMDLRPRSAVTLDTADTALARARAAMPAMRRRILEACSMVVADDGRIYAQEAEMLRAVAEAMDCPMPPLA